MFHRSIVSSLVSIILILAAVLALSVSPIIFVEAFFPKTTTFGVTTQRFHKTDKINRIMTTGTNGGSGCCGSGGGCSGGGCGTDGNSKKSGCCSGKGSSSKTELKVASKPCCDGNGSSSKTESKVASKPTETDSALFVDATAAATSKSAEMIQKETQEYYGETLQTSDDLKTNACCTAGSPPKYIQALLKRIHPTTLAKYYGCGLCLPQYDLTGCRILDLGCGAGRDVYMAAQLVGPTGEVVGVDMTKQQLDAANEYQEYHAKEFGYSNTKFLQGYLEKLSDIEGLEPNSFDVIISNCVINLCTDKPAVLKACYNLLKPGGELYFSDVYSNRRVPQSLQNDKVLWGECLSGALYWNDFENLARQAGFADPRLVEDKPITVQNKKVQESITNSGHAGLEFYSATYRLLKIPELEPACEDYGQAVVYKGTLPNAPSSWMLDKHHAFEQGRIERVCGNSYRMLYDNPRAKQHFDFYGTWDTHYGIYEGCCGGGLPYDAQGTKGSSDGGGGGGGGCC